METLMEEFLTVASEKCEFENRQKNSLHFSAVSAMINRICGRKVKVYSVQELSTSSKPSVITFNEKFKINLKLLREINFDIERCLYL